MRIRIIGAGVMGRGIAQWAAVAGHQIELADVVADAVTASIGGVRDQVNRMAEKGRLSADAAAEAIGRLHAAESPTAPGHDVDLVIEAVREDIDIKISLFRELEQVLPASTVLTTNTSSIPVTRIAAGLDDPTRLAGLHFFNPVPLMRIVEVIPGARTRADIPPMLVDLVVGTGHKAVVAADTPGFLVNHAGRGLTTEAFAIIEGGVAEVDDVDAIARDVLGLKMGPFELMDLTGLDVTIPASEVIWTGFRYSDRLRPPATSTNRLLAGLLGRKTVRGWYDYGEGASGAAFVPPAGLAGGDANRPVWVHGSDADADAVRAHLVALGAQVETQAQASSAAIVLVPTWGTTVASAIDTSGLPIDRTLGIDPLSAYPLAVGTERTVLAVTPATSPSAARDAVALAGGAARVTLVNDTVGSVAQRLIASIVGVAASIAERGIASPADIDLAVTLGLGYPRGPLAWGDHIGAERIWHLQQRLHHLTGDPRYAPSPWLTSRAQLGLPLTHTGTTAAALKASTKETPR